MPRTPHHRRVLGALIAGFLVAAGLVAAGSPARAAPTFADICSTCITFDTSPTLFDEASETVTATVEVNAPGDWAFVSGTLGVTDTKNIAHTDWLKLDSEKRIGQRDILTFTGKVPNQISGGALNRGYWIINPAVYYRFNGLLRVASVPPPPFKYYHLAAGDTKVTLAGPAQITTGSALTLTGNVSCFKAAGFQTVEEGASVDIAYSPTGANTWTTQGSVQASKTDGNWSFTVPAVGATLDWRTVVYPNSLIATYCVEGKASNVINVVAGTQPPPPPPPTLPGAPGLVVSGSTQSTISATWTAPASAPGQATITGYRFGYDSANGLPQPSFSTVVEVPPGPANPFVFTNLCAGCSYSVWVEAVTAAGTGARTTLSATTQAAPPPPPAQKAPGAPQSVSGQAGNHKATITWSAPDPVPGATVTKYCVHRFNFSPDKCVGAGRLKVKFKGLTNGLKYSFTVQAFAGDVAGPLSRVVKVKPKKG